MSSLREALRIARTKRAEEMHKFQVIENRIALIDIEINGLELSLARNGNAESLVDHPDQ